MKNLPFLKELCEARMFYGAKDVRGMSAKEIGELIYLLFMLLEVVRWTKKSEATSYASKTMELSPYDTMFYSGTDLCNLLAVLNHQDVFAGQIKTDGGLSLPLFQINRYLGAVRSGSNSSGSEDQTFFWRLEDYLKVYSNSAFRALRRDIGNWTNLAHADKVRITDLLRREFDKRASQADLYLWFKQNFKLKESVNHERTSMDETFERMIKNNIITKEQLVIAKEGLFEDQNELAKVKEFIALHKKNSLTPVVGKSYVPISLTFGGVYKFLEIKTTKNRSELLSADYGEDYKFRTGNKISKFPNNANAYSSIGDTLFFETPEEAESVITLSLLSVQFPGWKISQVVIDEQVDESIDTKLAYHDELNPALWESNGDLKEDVKDALGKIANKFSEFVDIKQLKIVDYIITGSNCNYNYTSQSDIDIHVLVDASALGENPLTEPFLTAKKALWNSGHDITVKGFSVELYAEDINKEDNQLVATGVYSLMQDKWLKKPTHLDIDMNDTAVQKKAEDIMNQIDAALQTGSTEELTQIREHIRKMRRAGLEEGGEFSVENLAFKAIRNNGYFEKMNNFEKHEEDEELTLEHSNEIK